MSKFSFQKKIQYFSPLVLQTLIWIPVRILFSIFLRLRVRGIENLNGLPSHTIFAANHSSELDAVIIPASLPLFSRFLPHYSLFREHKFYSSLGTHARLFYRPALLKIIGGVRVYSGKRNYERSLRDVVKILTEKRNGSFSMFPEGNMTRTGALGSTHGGVAFLVDRTKAPVVPVAINGLVCMKVSDFFLRRRNVSITFGKPITADALFIECYYTPLEYKQVAETIMGRVASLLNVVQ